MKIILTGSLGNIGKPLAAELVRNGHAVTVISTNKEKQREIERQGATAAIGSLEDADFLTETFKGADALFAMVPPDFAAPDLRAYQNRIGDNYVKAIGQAELKRVVFLSSFGADLDQGTGLILGMHDVENMLNRLQGVSVTHLRTGYFLTNLFTFTGMIKSAGMLGANYGGYDKLAVIHPKDIATAAAEELISVAGGSKVRYVAGEDRTCNEIAAEIGKAIGKPDLTWATFSDEQARQGMEAMGMSGNIISDLVEMGKSMHNGTWRADYDLHRPATTAQMTTADFAKEFAAAY